MSHKQEIIDLVLNKYHSQKIRAHLEFEAATMEDLILPKYIPVGHINRGRFEYMAEMMVKFNLVDDDYSLDDFIYEPNPQVDLKLFWQVSLSILLLLTLAIAAIYFMWHLNQRLHTEVKGRRQAEDHFRGIVDNLQDVYYRADNQSRIITVSPSIQKKFGYSADELSGRPIADLYAPPCQHSDFLAALEQSNGHLNGYETRILRKDQSTCWISVNSQHTIVDGIITGFEGTVRDINDLKCHEKQYQSLAMQDSLTQLPNRRYLIETLQKTIAQNIRRQQIGALLFIDLNKFKPVNDEHGHDVGDLLLIDIAKRFQHSVREEDSVIRMGGDEFVVILPILSTDKNDAMNKSLAIADKVIEASEKPFQFSDDIKDITIGASVGIALFPTDGKDIYQLIKKADKAMYTAKASKNNRAVIYTS